MSGRRSNGEEFPIEASISKIQVNNHTLLTMIFRDISRRKQAPEKQEGGENRFRSFFESAPACIPEIDPNGQATAINPLGLQIMHADERSHIIG